MLRLLGLIAAIGAFILFWPRRDRDHIHIDRGEPWWDFTNRWWSGWASPGESGSK